MADALDPGITLPQREPGSAPSQQEATQQQCRLLRLPAELRIQILRYLVTQTEPITLHQPDAPFTIDVNILSTCRQLRDEARPFLYRGNVLDIGIDSRGSVSSLLFSRSHSICEYRAEEAVNEVSGLFLDRFSRFQIRLLNRSRPDSLRMAIKRIEHGFKSKHVTVVLPSRTPGQLPMMQPGPRFRLYPQLSNPLLPFATLRCASFNVLYSDASPANVQFGGMMDLVTSNRPCIDMSQRCHDVHRSARAVQRILLPASNLFHEFDKLCTALFEHVWELCQCANKSDQDAFVIACEKFDYCYCQLMEL
ncbi:hypothetical protein H2200_000972 [Cladophialophora chaetospira]|uniref:F-box domain-containing protein n=1 Tax=Cladophialophora chaetospira TaxID=386627 RepID=A0AA38XPU8_9EURO|nr:hypothetical protein H2200_000972 [Cladophialophora chaetospira]